MDWDYTFGICCLQPLLVFGDTGISGYNEAVKAIDLTNVLLIHLANLIQSHTRIEGYQGNPEL